MSPVDDILRGGSAFADMDFATRNLYRTAIEEMARGIATRANSRSPGARSAPPERRRRPPTATRAGAIPATT